MKTGGCQEDAGGYLKPRRDGRKADRTARMEETRVCRIQGGNRARTEIRLGGKQRGVSTQEPVDLAGGPKGWGVLTRQNHLPESKGPWGTHHRSTKCQVFLQISEFCLKHDWDQGRLDAIVPTGKRNTQSNTFFKYHQKNCFNKTFLTGNDY